MNRENKGSYQEMEQIRRGLEEFLNQEMKDMDSSSNRAQGEFQIFSLDEEEELERETQKKEINIIGAQTRKRNPAGRRVVEEDYVEDWDSEEYQRQEAEVEEIPRRSNSAVKRSPAMEQQGQMRSERKQGNMSKTGKRHKEREEEQSMRKESGRAKKKRKKKKSRFKRFLVTVAVLAILLCTGAYYLVGKVYAKMNYTEIDSVAAAAMKEEGVVNILLIGSDSRGDGAEGRSDAMILLSISDKTKKIYMTSLLRDMYVEIPGYKGNRLNAAYSFGGAELLMETIEQNLDISVNRYVLVNFEAFANLVDAVDGIELELSSEEIEYVNAYLVEYNMLTDRPQGTDNMDTSVSGLVHLNGPQALAYSRNRYLGTDFGRTERQRKVLSAVIQKAPKALVTNPKELMDGLLPNLTTNLTQSETFRLSFMAPKILTYEIVQSSIPIDGTYQNATIRDMAVLEVDFEANKQYLRENVYGEGVSEE